MYLTTVKFCTFMQKGGRKKIWSKHQERISAGALKSQWKRAVWGDCIDVGVETVIADNDRKAHTKAVRDAWAKFGIKVWPRAGIVGDRVMIPEFTGKDASELDGFPVNSPDCMTNDQSVNNTWKNLFGRLYDAFRKRKLRQTTGGFVYQWPLSN